MEPTQTPQTAPMAPGVEAAPSSSELSQDQMRGNLQDMMSKIEGEYRNFNSQKFASDNKDLANKSLMMRKLFQMFKSMGVDPSDATALKNFLEQLKQSNPEVYQQVEAALEAILGDNPQDTPQTAGTTPTAIANDAPINNMNIDPNAQSTP